MAELPTFLILEGLLHEAGTFEVVRGYEDSLVRYDERRAAGPLGGVARLLDGNGQVLTSSPVDIRFPIGCGATSVGPGAGLVRCVLARHEDAARFELRVGDRAVYSAEVGRQPPTVEAKMHVKEDTAVIDVATDANAEVRILAELADGRRRAAARRDGNSYVVPLGDFEGFGSARLIVEASLALRTTRVAVGRVKLPAATIMGQILEPEPGARLPFGARRSLIGNLSDRNGRRVEWGHAKVAWLVNGQIQDRADPVVGWQPDRPGEQRIELVRYADDGRPDVLDARTVTVMEQTPAQKEYAAALAALRERRTSPQPDP
jgi:hypothetical protein